jgi:hypothetical protein
MVSVMGEFIGTTFSERDGQSLANRATAVPHIRCLPSRLTGFPQRIALSYRCHGRIGASIRSGCLVNISWVIDDGQDFIDVWIRPFRQGRVA